MAADFDAGVALDCSASLALFLDDETPDIVDALFEALTKREFWVPVLWRCEFANALLTAQRRRRVTPAVAQRILAQAERLPLNLDDKPPSTTRLFEIAATHDLTAYDAAYLELAQRRSLELATLDRALAGAAQRAGIGLFPAPARDVHEPKAPYQTSRRRR